MRSQAFWPTLNFRLINYRPRQRLAPDAARRVRSGFPASGPPLALVDPMQMNADHRHFTHGVHFTGSGRCTRLQRRGGIRVLRRAPGKEGSIGKCGVTPALTCAPPLWPSRRPSRLPLTSSPVPAAPHFAMLPHHRYLRHCSRRRREGNRPVHVAIRTIGTGMISETGSESAHPTLACRPLVRRGKRHLLPIGLIWPNKW